MAVPLVDETSFRSPNMSFGNPPVLPSDVKDISSLGRCDYGDEFSIAVPRPPKPEQWMRKIFGDTPNTSQKCIWSGLLGFDLSELRSPETIAGNRVTGRGVDWIRVENRSWFLAANIICKTSKDKISIITLIRYDHWVARWWWTPLSAVHRMLVPRILRRAAERKKPLEKL